MGKLRKIVSMVASVVAMSAAVLVIAPAAADASPVPCGRGVRACIDLSAQRAWLMDGKGHVTYGGASITSGRPGYRTPVGVYRVTWKDIDHWSKEFNGPMPYSVFFTRSGIAFHEGSLSVPSHGCIHLSHAAAVRFFNRLQPGNVVAVQP
jgi:lipoprotein-anchoring transpeptidase ErfK/SrfK